MAITAPHTLTVTLVDGVRVVVPDSLDLITPYVLLEQEDWFEDEIKFLRRLLKPGQQAIDIGANFGVYALSMARTVGPTGRIFAFEPASGTAELLELSAAANAFAQVVLDRRALSAASGTARLSLHQNSELNALVRGTPGPGATEEVAVTTLDECMETYGWHDIDFVKIDAEGEEAAILKGGARFFSQQSPLIQYEIKAGKDLHMELVDGFAALGYRSYRLVPGLDLLVPFDARSRPDGYLLNLFCCTRDRAARLSAEGYLLDDGGSSSASPIAGTTSLTARPATSDAYGWRRTLAKLPYGSRLSDVWTQTMVSGSNSKLDRALALYGLSRDRARSPGERFGALDAGLKALTALCEHQASHLRLASLARMARDYGARSLAVGALQHLANTVLQQNRADPSEPFLAPGDRYDTVHPGNSIHNWVIAAVLEETERLDHYSSYYAGVSSRQRLEAIRDLGFGSPEMARRLDLVTRRFGSR